MKAWLFDVDGVITNLDTRKIEHPQIILGLVQKLKDMDKVALITGRELPWLLTEVISKIEEQVNNKTLLNNLYIEAEFGGITVSYFNGIRKESLDTTNSIPLGIIKRARKIIMRDYGDLVYDPGKQTHFTAELRKGINHIDFLEKRTEIAQKFLQLIKEHYYATDIEVHEDVLAVNIKNKNLNKHLAVAKFLKWLKENNYHVNDFYVFGDSKSDTQMGLELNSNGKNVTYFHTGKIELENLPFKVIKTQQHFDEGTVEYLKNN